MKSELPDFDCASLSRLVEREFGLDVSSVEFVPKGEDAFNYRVECGDGRRFFVRVQPPDRTGDLETGLAVAWALHHVGGLRAALAPLRTREGRLLCTLGACQMAVFPYLAGCSDWEQAFSDEELAMAASAMARLHANAVAGCDIPRETFCHPFEAPIVRAIRAARRDSSAGGSLRSEACRLLLREEADVCDTIDRVERLAATLRESGMASVLTHGDPNSANWVRDGQGGLRLVDWGEAALGPPERDLFAFTGGRFTQFLRHYSLAAGAASRKAVTPPAPLPHPCGLAPGSVHLRPRVFQFYFYRWSLQEIADYATRLLFGRPGDWEQEHAWAELRDYLPVRHDSIAQSLRQLEETLGAAPAAASKDRAEKECHDT